MKSSIANLVEMFGHTLALDLNPVYWCIEQKTQPRMSRAEERDYLLQWVHRVSDHFDVRVDGAICKNYGNIIVDNYPNSCYTLFIRCE